MTTYKQNIFKAIKNHLKEDQQVFKTDKPIGLGTFVKNKNASNAILEDAFTDLQKTIGKDLAGAVADLKSKASDDEFKKAAVAGTEDGEPEDEKVPFSTTPVPATKMFPTQAEIGFGNSLDDICNDQFGAIDSAFSNPVLMPSKAGKIPVLTARIGSDIAILDGHHRWSACFMINPTAKMSCDIMEPPAGTSAEDALKVMQLAIAANAGNVVTVPFDGKDLMAVSTDEVIKYIIENIGEKEIATFAKYNKALNSKEAIAEHIGKSHKLILGMKGPFPRTVMPQAKDSGTSQTTVNQSLEKGSINFKEPFTAKESVKRYNNLLKESQIIYRQLTLAKEWLRTGKRIDELKLTSAGIPELLQLVYDRQDVLPKLGYKDFKDFLKWINDDWEQEDHAEAVKALQLLNVPGAQQLIHETRQYMKTKRRQRLEEELVRRLVRKTIKEVTGNENKKPVNEVLFSLGILLVALPFLIGFTAVFGVAINFLKNKQKITAEEEAELRSMFTSNKKQAVKQVLDKFGGVKNAATELGKDLDFKKAVEQMPTIAEGEDKEQEVPEPEEVQDEPGLDPELSELTDIYIRKLKNARAPVESSDTIEIVGQILDSFGYGNQDKVAILQGIRQLVVR